MPQMARVHSALSALAGSICCVVDYKRRRSQDIRVLNRDIAEHLEASCLDYDIAHMSFGRGQSGWVMYANRTLIGTFSTKYAGDFLMKAPGWIKQLQWYIRELEEEAYQDRARSRRLRGIESHLHRLKRVGAHTVEGQQEVRDMLAEFDRNESNERERHG